VGSVHRITVAPWADFLFAELYETHKQSLTTRARGTDKLLQPPNAGYTRNSVRLLDVDFGENLPAGKAEKEQTSVNQFERELNLARRPCRLADNSKAAAAHNVGRQSKIHNIKDVEELRAKFKDPQLALTATPKRRVFDQGHIKVAEARSSKRVAAQRAKAAAIGACPASHIDRNGKERTVVRA